MTLPPDPFGRPCAVPAAHAARQRDEHARRQRVAWLAEVSQALIAGRAPSGEAAMFLGSALGAWLSQGGRLERDFLRVAPRRGSNQTAQALARGLALRQGRED